MKGNSTLPETTRVLNEEWLETTLRSIGDAVITTNSSGEIQFINQSGERMFGRSLGDITGKEFDQLFQFKDARTKSPLGRLVEKVLDEGEVVKFRDYALIQNGQSAGKAVLVSASPITEDNDRITGVVLVLRDVTERKEAELAVRESEQNFREIFEHMQSGFLRTDPEGRILLMNPQLAEMIGLRSQEQLGGLRVQELPFTQHFNFGSLSRQLKTRGEVRGLQGTLVTADHQKIQISVNAYAVHGEDDAVRYYEGTLADITEMKAIERDLKKSRDQLRQFTRHQQDLLEEERKKIARYIHDELGQGLTALKMDTVWIRRKLPESSENLRDKVEGMTELIDDSIKAVKHISARLRPRLLDDLGLVPAIEWQAEAFERRIGVKCSVSVTPADITLDMDRSIAVVRIIQEALTNVARHAEASEVTISVDRKDAALHFAVRDNGRGFRVEDGAGKNSFGLIGIRERAFAWDGKVTLEGKPGEGTSISVVIPLEEERAPANSPEHRSNEREKKITEEPDFSDSGKRD